MEFPFGHHHHHHHHHQRNDQEDEQPPSRGPFDQPPPPPPPSYYQQDEYPPPRTSSSPYYQETEFVPPPPPRPSPLYYQETEYAPPPRSEPTHVTHLHHTSDQQEFNSFNYQSPRPPQTAEVSHVAHEETETSHHSFKPHLPSFLHSHTTSASDSFSHLSNKPTVRVYCKADPNLSLSIRDGKVILATSDPTDEFQHWYKDEKFSTRVKDEEGFPSFALVNKATGQAMKHSVGATHPVQLIHYNADALDASILWSESKDLGDGYRAVRMINNIRLNVDAFHGDKKSGGVHDGTTIVLWQWAKGDNQRWKMNPYR